jgi:glycosyltransferase involved in cell wall biosynthesis
VEGARALWPAARLRLVPNVVDVAAIAPVTPATGSQRIVFVGDLTYEPNRDAVAFLCDEVMPRVWRARPSARLTIAGRGGRPRGDDRVEVLGFIIDLRALYASAAAVAVPLLRGGGSPLKFVEALAYGVPVVATPTAARGLDAVPGRDFLEATNAETFAAALVSVLDRGAPEIAAHGRTLAQRRYSIDALARELRR